MSRIHREKFLIAKGNQPIVVAGTALFNTSTKEYQVAEGQIGFFDANTKLALSAATVAAAGDIMIVRGMGKGSIAANSKTIRTMSGHQINACKLTSATAEPYRAGTTGATDFLFNCTTCSETYGLGVGIDNVVYNAFMPNNKINVEPIIINSIDCDTCGAGCAQTHNCSEMVDKFVSQISANTQLAEYLTVVAIPALDPVLVANPGFTCGLRFTLKTKARECGCFPPVQENVHDYVKLLLTLGTGFTNHNTKIIKTGLTTLSEGTGDKLQWREYREETGGPGNPLGNTVDMYGPDGAHIALSRKNQITTDCATNYCQYALATTSKGTVDQSGFAFETLNRTIIAVPQADVATQTAIQGVLNAWFNAKPCAPDVTLTCASDSDATDAINE
jgi:hypothetical protein